MYRYESLLILKLNIIAALARWLYWLEHRPVHQKAEGLIPGQGSYLGCGFDAQLGCVQERTNRCFSLT